MIAILNVNVICRPRSESDTRGQGREEPSSSKIDVKSEEIKPEVKEESGAGKAWPLGMLIIKMVIALVPYKTCPLNKRA